MGLTVQMGFVKRSVPENFQWEIFSGLVPMRSLRTQDSENVFGLVWFGFEGVGAQSEVIGQKSDVSQKTHNFVIH